MIKIIAVEKTIDGAWEFTAKVRDHRSEHIRTKRIYGGFTEREARRIFRQYIKDTLYSHRTA
jgi:hypothetical protein